MFAPRLFMQLREGDSSTARGKAASPLPCPRPWRLGTAHPCQALTWHRHTVKKVRALHWNSLDNNTKLKPKLFADYSVLLRQISKWLIDHKTKGKDQASRFHEDEGSLARPQETTRPAPAPFPCGRRGLQPRRRAADIRGSARPRSPPRPPRWKGQDREENAPTLGIATFLLASLCGGK